MQFAGIKTSLVEFDLILGIPGIGFLGPSGNTRMPHRNLEGLGLYAPG
jgi:hypothetical protein